MHRSTPFTTLYHGLTTYFHYFPEIQFSDLEEFLEAGAKFSKGTKLADEVVRVLNEYEIPVMSQKIMQRVAYPDSASVGKTVFHTSDHKAQQEIENICRSILIAPAILSNIQMSSFK